MDPNAAVTSAPASKPDTLDLKDKLEWRKMRFNASGPDQLTTQNAAEVLNFYLNASYRVFS